MSTLNIGENLYRYVSPLGIFTYTVKGVRAYEDNTQYEVECQTCTHGYKCKLLIAENESGKFKYVSLLNYDDDDDQRYWHNCKEYSTFWKTKAEAHIECYMNLRSKLSSEIVDEKKKMAAMEKRYAEINSALELAETNYKLEDKT
jgi:hypothetical protein